MKSIKHIWFTPESSDGQRSLKQHAYYNITRLTPITGTEYKSNRAVCSSRHRVSKEGPRDVQIEKLENESPNPANMCKICAKKMGY